LLLVDADGTTEAVAVEDIGLLTNNGRTAKIVENKGSRTTAK
jgi:hypothetical protein